MSTVDIVVPCYNYARYLRTCVSSVLTQGDVDVRVLVIDDASSDETARVGAELAAADSRVEFRRHEVNRGHITTYNEGLLNWSRSDYCVLLSADDMLTPGSLGRAVSIMDSDPKIGMVYGPTVHFRDEKELPEFRSGTWDFSKWSGSEWLERRCRDGHNVITSPEVVVRGSIQRSVGGYNPELPHAGDLEMWLRIAAVSDIAYVRRVPQAFYRVHSASMMRSKYNGQLLDLYQRKAVFEFFFKHYGNNGNRKHLHDEARRALAREALWDACRAYDHNKLRERKANELVEFAQATYPTFATLPEFRALERRRRLGAVWCNRTQLFIVSAIVKRVQHWSAKRKWKRRGI
jgi:glycosyltransferase involved in cell wall biosynthesis